MHRYSVYYNLYAHPINEALMIAVDDTNMALSN